MRETACEGLYGATKARYRWTRSVSAIWADDVLVSREWTNRPNLFTFANMSKAVVAFLLGLVAGFALRTFFPTVVVSEKYDPPEWGDR